MLISSIRNKIIKIFEYFIEILLPKDKEVENLEGMSISDWQEIVCLEKTKEIIHFFSYKNKKVKKALWEIKYRQNKKIRENMLKIVAKFLVEELTEKKNEEDFSEPLITFIPMSKKRISEREINQSEILARDISELLHIPFAKIITKIRETKRQTILKRTERLSNIKNSFGVLNKENIFGKNIIVIDDITTTGATLIEAKKILIENGASKILCVAIAH